MSSKTQRRNRLCVEPKYPGKPEDYVYIPEHCRRLKVSAFDRRKRLDILKRRISNFKVPRFGKTRTDIVLKRSYEIFDAYPEYILFMVQGMRNKSNIRSYPDPDVRFKKVRESWTKIAIPNSEKAKFVIFSLTL